MREKNGIFFPVRVSIHHCTNMGKRGIIISGWSRTTLSYHHQLFNTITLLLAMSLPAAFETLSVTKYHPGQV